MVSPDRFKIGFELLACWLLLKQEGKALSVYFEDNLICNIAIYGMGVLGERLYEELKNSEVTVCYAIDRLANLKNRKNIKIYNSNENSLPLIDAIVVTPIQDYWTIVNLLEMKTDAAIISLKDIIDYCLSGE